ncbi:MAG: hypothetical protein IOD12_17275 [Silvanigrellales bacterium]|nr:hypothetical protein [Silvanigrellales bacterium]
MTKVLYFYPTRIAEEKASGSSIRPARMLHAFQNLGFDVIPIVGTSDERRRAFERARRWLRQDAASTLLYGEFVNFPMCLSDSGHTPSSPWLDAALFAETRSLRIPSGLFYRDAYWREPHYTSGFRFPFIGHALACLFRFEWNLIVPLLDILFVPSLPFAEILPPRPQSTRVESLPPGHGSPILLRTPAGHGPLRIVYGGGVRPPHYDLSPMLQGLAGLNDIELVIMCREAEWREAREYYVGRLGEAVLQGVQVKHVSGEAFDAEVQSADVFGLFREKHPYLDSAYPLKLFDAIGNKAPLITNAETIVGEFVAARNIGWTVRNIEEFVGLARQLASNRSALAPKRAALDAVYNETTWRARALQAHSSLESARAPGVRT